MKNKYGISLIVLIVTIIVMIIIAGAIIMTLSGTGIIDKAENGVDLHNQAVEREQIIMALSRYQLQKNTKDNPQTFLAVMQEELSKDATVSGSTNGPVTVTFNRSTNKYLVYENGTIIGPNSNDVALPDELAEYILGPTLQGRNFEEIFNGEEFINADFDIEFFNAAENLVNIANGIYSDTVYIKYNDNEYYKFDVLLDEETGLTYTDAKSGVQFIAKLDGTNRIGEQVEYAGILWTILYDDEKHGVQMISNDALTDINGELLTIGSDEDLEEAILSYNSAITTINNACKAIIPSAPGVIKNIRSVGSNSIDATDENKTLYTSSKFAEMVGNTNAEKINGKLYSSDFNYISDSDQLLITNLITPTNEVGKDERYYWLASRYMYFWDEPEYSLFISGPLYMSGYPSPNETIYATNEDEAVVASSSMSCYLRPVITLEDDIINRLEGNGTTASPYNLDKYYESTIITTETANSIPNGTYYNFGLNNQTTKLIIDDSGNEFCFEDSCADAAVTINNGAVTVNATIAGSSFALTGNYYETRQNKILTLGAYEFKNNSRLGFLFAINTKDLKYDIAGTFKGGKTGAKQTLVFTRNNPTTLYTYLNSENMYFPYAGFKDMFYLNNYQIRYTGLTDGFDWEAPGEGGVFYKQ